MADTIILEKIKQTVDSSPVLLFMKGTRDAPQCGFSAQVIHVLKSYNVPFETVDVLADYDLREGVKEYANWPTIPQLYINGQFVGGCDITMEMHRKGELAEALKAVAK